MKSFSAFISGMGIGSHYGLCGRSLPATGSEHDILLIATLSQCVQGLFVVVVVVVVL